MTMIGRVCCTRVWPQPRMPRQRGQRRRARRWICGQREEALSTYPPAHHQQQKGSDSVVFQADATTPDQLRARTALRVRQVANRRRMTRSHRGGLCWTRAGTEHQRSGQITSHKTGHVDQRAKGPASRAGKPASARDPPRPHPTQRTRAVSRPRHAGSQGVISTLHPGVSFQSCGDNVPRRWVTYVPGWYEAMVRRVAGSVRTIFRLTADTNDVL